MTLAEQFGLVSRFPGGPVVFYEDRPSYVCVDCGTVFSDAVAPLHEARLGHKTSAKQEEVLADMEAENA